MSRLCKQLSLPLTPATIEDLQSLLNKIKEDAGTLDETSKRELLRHTQLMAKAMRVTFAERSLLQNHYQFLSKVNSEVQARCSIKLLVLGMVKVMTYEPLEQSRAKRAAKAAAAVNKIKCRRKRKAAALG